MGGKHETGIFFFWYNKIDLMWPCVRACVCLFLNVHGRDTAYAHGARSNKQQHNWLRREWCHYDIMSVQTLNLNHSARASDLERSYKTSVGPPPRHLSAKIKRKKITLVYYFILPLPLTRRVVDCSCTPESGLRL